MTTNNKRTFSEDDKIRIGVTHGDVNGIGYEVIIKTFQDQRVLDDYQVVVYGVSNVASYHQKTVAGQDLNFNVIRNASVANPKKLNLVNCYNGEVKIEIGKPSRIAGEVAYFSLESALKDIKDGLIDVIVTAPINKKTIHSDRFEFPGHTEYFARQFEVSDYLMLMVGGTLRIGVVTGHIPLKEVPDRLTTDLIMEKIRVMDRSLVKDFAIRRPKIAVLGLNPHAGDEGLIGSEDKDIILPAIRQAKEESILAFGPYPADGFFASEQLNKFDGILAMYHDQGLIPFKAIAFNKGVNFTAGLPIVRTSPAHGTAYEIAGKDMASPESFREAVYLAAEIFRNRTEYEQLTANPLPNYLDEMDSGSSSHQHAGGKDDDHRKDARVI